MVVLVAFRDGRWKRPLRIVGAGFVYGRKFFQSSYSLRVRHAADNRSIPFRSPTQFVCFHG
jgi:hypothetical protein